MAEVKLKKFMKRILMIIVVLILGSGAWWLLAQTNAPSANAKVLYYTCPMHPSVKADKPGNCPICGMELTAVYENAAATNNAPSHGTNDAAGGIQAKPYPLTTCVVDGMDLHSMGKPYVFVYEGQEIKLCCPDCKPEFLKDPAKYLKKIQDAETAAHR